MLVHLLACVASPSKPTPHSAAPTVDTVAHSAAGESGAAGHTGVGCGGLFLIAGRPFTGRIPGTPTQEVCDADRPLSEVCATSSWRGPFPAGCPDLATFRAAIEAGTIDPGGMPIGRARTLDCAGAAGTWTGMAFESRVPYYDAASYRLWFHPSGALSLVVEDHSESYDGAVCCAGTETEDVWYGDGPPSGVTCVDGPTIEGPPPDSGGSGR